MDVGVANYQLTNRDNGDDFMVLEESLNSEQYGIGFRLGDTELCDQVNAALEQLVEDGTVAELAEKYDLSDMVCLDEQFGEATTAEAAE